MIEAEWFGEAEESGVKWFKVQSCRDRSSILECESTARSAGVGQRLNDLLEEYDMSLYSHDVLSADHAFILSRDRY